MKKLSESLKSRIIFRLFPQPDLDMLQSLFRRFPGAIDEVWFCSLLGFPTLEEHRIHAQSIAQQAKKLCATNIVPGLQIANTIGHGGQIVGSQAAADRFQRFIDLETGKEDSFCLCPRDPGFLAYVEEVAVIYASTAPVTSMWLDDDLRMHHHGNALYGCACGRCLAEFSRRNEKNWNRTELFEALNVTDIQPLRRAWIDFNNDAIMQVARRAAKGAAASGRPILTGLQECGLEWGWYDGVSLKPVLQAMAEASHHPTGRRPGHGNYTDHAPRGAFAKYLMISREAADADPETTPVIAAEIENYPHTVMGKSPLGTVVEATLDINAGCNALSFVLTGTLNSEPEELLARQLSRIAAWRPLWDRLLDTIASCHCRAGGLNLYRSMNFPTRALPGGSLPHFFSQSYGAPAEWLPLGIPLSARDGDAPAQLITAETAEAISPEEWRQLKRGGLVLDGAAAATLFQRGLIDDWGIRPVADSGPNEELLADGSVCVRLGEIYRFERTGDFPWEVPGEVRSRIDGRVLGAGTLFGALPEGGRALLLGYTGWCVLVTAAKRRQIFDLIDRIVPGKLAARLETPVQAVVILQLDPTGQLRTLTIQNASIDNTPELTVELRLPAAPAELEWVRPDFDTTRLEAAPGAIPGTWHVILPGLAGFHPGVLFIGSRSNNH